MSRRGEVRGALRRKLAVECFAVGNGSPIETALEPLRTLSAGSVGPLFGAYGPAGHFLQVIVADCRRGLQSLVYVFGMHDVALLRAVSPHTREAVCLQFEIDGERIAFSGIFLR